MGVKPTLLAGAIGVALTLGVGYYIIYVPYQNRVSQIHTQVAEEQANQQTQAEVASLLQQVEQYRKRLPQGPDPSWLVREVVGLTESTGVTLTTISQDPPRSFGPFTRLGVKIQISTSYHQLGSLPDAIERSSHFIRVERFTVTRPSEEGQPAIATLVLETIHLPKMTGLL